MLKAALHCYDQCLDAHEPGTGVGGYQMRISLSPRGTPIDQRTMGYKDASGFLNGTSGIGLALLAGISNIEPRWDCVLGLS